MGTAGQRDCGLGTRSVPCAKDVFAPNMFEKSEGGSGCGAGVPVPDQGSAGSSYAEEASGSATKEVVRPLKESYR